MALYKFTKSIFENKPINIYNYGNMVRDFTFIDDVVECIICLSFLKSKNKTHEIYNIGNERPVKLMEYIRSLENIIGIKAKKNFLELQKGDVLKTHSNSNKLYKTIKFKPSVLLEDGLRKYVDWYKSFYVDEIRFMYLDFIFFYLLSFTVSVLLTFLIVVSKKFHGKFVLDTHDGPQKYMMEI